MNAPTPRTRTIAFAVAALVTLSVVWLIADYAYPRGDTAVRIVASLRR